ncbi:MAG TPA: FtsX-like permease family protein [Rhizomicrobium sp.]|nr:FtsX-like permease family protein [Rhizomicrobium sp.]
MKDLVLALKLARREMRSGFSGFRIFFACLVLGVTAVAGVGSLSSALLTGLAQEGRTLLGGDVSVHLVHRPMEANELAFLKARGRVSETVTMRAMAYALKNGREEERQLIELKAVDHAYPLYGAASLSPAMPLPQALACTKVVCGIAVEQTLLDRLRLPIGGKLRIGSADFRVTAMLGSEPDRISGGFSLGPHVLMSDDGLARTGLVTLGSLIEYAYRVALPPTASIAQFRDDAKQAFPDSGWEIRDRNDAAPGIKRFVEQVTMFLTLVGLTALAVGGVGAGQAVSAFLDRKREEIATLKSLGAEGGLVFLVYFLQVMAIAVAAVIVGLVLGAALPYLVEALFAKDIPAPAHYGVYPEPLALAALFGLLSAAAFAIPPLARAREIMPASLFRDVVARARAQGRLPYLAAAALAGLCVIGLALALAPSLMFAGWFLAGAAGSLIVLRVAAWAMQALLRRLPRPRRPVLRLALANLTRPGAAAASVVVALGLGLTLLATVTLLDRTIASQVKDNLPTLAPTFFFVDIQPGETDSFDKTIARFPSQRDYKRTPMIRGRITALHGVPAAKVNAEPGARWALAGDRGITYAATPPKGTRITEGEWWPAGYRGPTLISFDAELAPGLGLKLGDTLTLNVLGREIEGKIVNFRHVDFSNGNQNFILILSPGLIDKAPHSFLATVRVDPSDEEPMYRAVTDKFPGVSTVRVKDAIAQVNGLLQQLSDGVRAASLVTILAGLLVLAGAIAAGQRARLYDSTVMKVLGATRAQIATVYAIEYGLIGLATGLIALVAGTVAAQAVTERVFAVAFDFDPGAVLATVFGGLLATLGFGLIAAWSALAARPAELLRHP